MLILALIGAFLLYVVLYFFYEAASPHLGAATPLIVSVREMLFSLPQSAPLAFLKLGLILFAFYVIIDALRAAVTRGRRKH